MKLLAATSNAGKLREIAEILGPLLAEGGHALASLAALRLPAPDETGATFEENAALKATTCAVQSGLWTLADDSGLCVDALGGAPGVFSARYAPTDEERRAKLLRALDDAPPERRGAHFFCAVALSSPDGARLFRAAGRLEGYIARAPRGANGFGYDPLFVPVEPGGRTLGELPEDEKNRLSHRGRALERLAPLLRRLLREGDLPSP
ncbi:MAG: RdgB/HAM1 family non-canonical purine NTP pyrophosphatase [Myxococcales bacterium]